MEFNIVYQVIGRNYISLPIARLMHACNVEWWLNLDVALVSSQI